MDMDKKVKEYIGSVYYDPSHPASFSGINKLYETIRKNKGISVNKNDLTKWLQGQDVYSMYKPYKSKFRRSRVVVKGIDDLWDMDLMDMSKYSKENNGFKYLLVLIDIFSRFLIIEPVKSKHSTEIKIALSKVFDKRKPVNIRSDKGGEFVNKTIEIFFKKHKINHFVSQNLEKANYAECVIRTIKSKIFKYFLSKMTNRYIDILPNIVESYNKTTHASIGIPPEDVTSDNESTIWVKQYLKSEPIPKSKYKFNVGDLVRIPFYRNIFSKDSDEKWTGELFRIAKRYFRGSKPIYRIQDYSGEDIKGTLYEPELQLVPRKKDYFAIEKVLKTRKKNKNKEVLVRWLYWPPKYDSWIRASSLKSIRGGK